MTPLNLLVVSIVPTLMLFVIYKKFERLDLRIVGLMIIVLVLSVAIQAFMFNGATAFPVIEKILLTALGFGGGIFTAGQVRLNADSQIDDRHR